MEEPLPAGGSCLLGSINLAAYVKNGQFDFFEFEEDIHVIVKAMNEVLDQGLPLHPLQVQRDSVRDWRQIGIGIMGLADMLIKLELKYDTLSAQKFCDRIGYVMANEAIKASALLAKKDGAYPKFDKDSILASPFLIYNTTEETYALVERYGLRNSQILTIAPSGTLSTMLGISGGIEPIFSLSYTRKTEYNGVDQYHKVFTPIADEYMKEHGLTEEEELPNFFVTAQNIDPFKRVEMQGIWQNHIDASISSTVNLPNSATIEEVEGLYMHAWKHGLKGMTIFRDGCDRAAILSTGKPKEENKEEVKENVNGVARGVVVPTSDDVIGLKKKLAGGCGSLHLQVYFDRTTGKMSEVFINKGGTGGCNSNLNALSRMISIALRAGVDVEDIADQLASTINCPSFASSRAKGINLSPGTSCASAVGRALIELNKEFQVMFKAMKQLEEDIDVEDEVMGLEICPECGAKALEMSGGCQVCKECGMSKCD